MHFLALAAPLLLASSPAAATWHRSGDVNTAEDSVPGDNPLTFCGDTKDYSLNIGEVDLSPNPPQAGHKLTITANGNLTKEVEKGAQLDVSVAFGPITIIHLTQDLCDQVKQINLECPLKAGQDFKFTKEVDLPGIIPPGTYHATANAIAKDGSTITCLKTTISFNLMSENVPEDL